MTTTIFIVMVIHEVTSKNYYLKNSDSSATTCFSTAKAASLEGALILM